MPRGNPQNLRPQNLRTKEERTEISRKAGKKSGEARRNKALLKDCLQILMEQKIENGDGTKITGAEALAVNLFQKALEEGDTAKAAKAFEVLRDTAGQKPVEKVEQLNANITVDFADLADLENNVEPAATDVSD